MERKLRIPQIRGVRGRMPYAAASQQPSTASFGMRLCKQAPEIEISSAFLKGEESLPLVVILLKKKPTDFFT